MEGQKVIIKKVKKVVHEGGGHGGSSWKVAYADFVTAMMAFFLLLWLLTMTSGEKRARVSNYFRYFSIFSSGGSAVLNASTKKASDVAVIPQQVDIDGERFKRSVQTGQSTPLSQAGGDPATRELSRDQVKQKILSDMSSRLTEVKDQVLVESIEGGLRIQLVDKESSQMFPVGSAELSPQAKEILKVICDTIRDRNSKFAIEGHTDARPYPSDYYTNWELSTERASTARLELQQNGIAADRILQISGFADTQPLIQEDPYDPRNRRISVLLIDNNPPEAPPPSL